MPRMKKKRRRRRLSSSEVLLTREMHSQTALLHAAHGSLLREKYLCTCEILNNIAPRQQPLQQQNVSSLRAQTRKVHATIFFPVLNPKGSASMLSLRYKRHPKSWRNQSVQSVRKREPVPESYAEQGVDDPLLLTR